MAIPAQVKDVGRDFAISVRSETRPFFDLYSRGEVAAEQIDDFVTEWHDLPENDERSLANFLGMAEEEFSVWIMAPGALSAILAARRQHRPLTHVIRDYLADLRHAARQSDHAAVLSLTNWLKQQSIDD